METCDRGTTSVWAGAKHFEACGILRRRSRLAGPAAELSRSCRSVLPGPRNVLWAHSLTHQCSGIANLQGSVLTFLCRVARVTSRRCRHRRRSKRRFCRLRRCAPFLCALCNCTDSPLCSNEGRGMCTFGSRSSSPQTPPSIVELPASYRHVTGLGSSVENEQL